MLKDLKDPTAPQQKAEIEKTIKSDDLNKML